MSEQRIKRIFESGCRAALTVTGGGSGVVHALLSTPGASKCIADVRIPYSPQALAEVLGESVKQSCSPTTARALAEKAFFQCLENYSETLPALGIGCTAALQTDRERRGDDRAFICIKTAEAEKLYVLCFSKTSRMEQEELLSGWILTLIAQSAGAERGLLLPGSFNPLHRGHLGLLKAAEEITGLRGIFELSAVNVDKSDIPDDEMVRRAEQIRDIPVALTRASRFTEKAKLFPETTFVLGHDTVERLIRYAEPGEWQHFQTLETKFIVAGRIFQPLETDCAPADRARRAQLQSFQTLECLDLPEEAGSLFTAIPEKLFREDICSTALRDGGGC